VLSHIKVSSFLFHLEPIEPIELPPYKGSTLRGAFGHCFKKVICVLNKKDCNICDLKSCCVYMYVFDTKLPKKAKMMRKYETIPHPFVLTPPLTKKRVFYPEEKIEFSLTLIGKARQYLPYFVYTFKKMGEIGIGKAKGRFRLKEVLSLNGDKYTKIYDANEGTLKEFEDTYVSFGKGKGLEKIALKFLTPTRIKYSGRFVSELEFHILIRALLRRISALSYFHCGKELDLDYKGIIQSATTVKSLRRKLFWYDWQRFSNRQNTHMKMGGFMGEIEFEGDIERFYPLIALGEYIHVGKGTSFGLGRYEIKGLNNK